MLAAVAAVLLAGSVATLVVFLRPDPAPPKALLVDQLDQTFPNREWVNRTATLLLNGGYKVDYAPPEKVTVDFYRELGAHHYDLIVLRAHVARLGDRTTNKLGDDAIIFTSEPYTEDKYVEDQRAGVLAFAHTYSGGELYFGVLPEFIRSTMKGNLGGATVIIMGCDGLRSGAAAQALVEKGAEVVIGWDGPVSSSHTDAATERLLEHLVAERHSAAEAVAATAVDVGPDPAFGGRLRLYPAEESALVFP